jgi:adenine-specific DNA-methyltransferase
VTTQLDVQPLFGLGDVPGVSRRSQINGKWAPVTEGIKYAGAKTKLLPIILRAVEEYHPSTVLDGFSGSTRVTQALAKCGYTVVSTDLSVWSECLATAYLFGRSSTTDYEDLLAHMNGLRPVFGWFSEHYGGNDGGNGCAVERDGTRRVWQLKNSMRIDAVRDEIARLRLSDIDSAVCLTALILAADRVDSTIGQYASFLKEWSPRSYNDLTLVVPRLCPYEPGHSVGCGDIREILDRTPQRYDVAYLDPPYGSNNDRMPSSRVRYSAYYNLWTSIVLNDHPETYGRANRRVDTSDRRMENDFEDFRINPRTGQFLTYEAISTVLDRLTCNALVLSYSTEGRIPVDSLAGLLETWGEIRHITAVDYRRNVMSAMRWTNEWAKDTSRRHQELVFSVSR